DLDRVACWSGQMPSGWIILPVCWPFPPVLMGKEPMMTTIQFGWRVPAFPVDGSESDAFTQQIQDNLRLLAGKFQSAWVADHFIPWPQFHPYDSLTLECLSTISYLACVYPSLDFGRVVLCQSYRNPAPLSQMAATLQWITGGRFILGIGAGWKAEEYRAY